MLGRSPAAAERNAWLAYLAADRSGGPKMLARAFFGSPEHVRRPATPGDRVRHLYRATLGREPSTAEVVAWSPVILAQFDALVPMFVGSREFLALGARTAPHTLVDRLYRVVLGRAPSAQEVASWVAFVTTTGDWGAVARGFLDSPEYLATPRSGADHIRTLYRTFLLREASQPEVDAWVAYLAGRLAPIADGFTGSAEFQARVPGMF